MNCNYYRIPTPSSLAWKVLYKDPSGLENLLEEIPAFDTFEKLLQKTNPGDMGLLIYDDARYALYLRQPDGNLVLLSSDVELMDLAYYTDPN